MAMARTTESIRTRLQPAFLMRFVIEPQIYLDGGKAEYKTEFTTVQPSPHLSVGCQHAHTLPSSSWTPDLHRWTPPVVSQRAA
eukprot:3004091-Rhodomonas_salina.2